MTLTSNEYGSFSKLPGARTKVQIDPTKLSTRMRNAVIKMIESGTSVGGYSAKSQKLANAIADAYAVPMVKLQNYGALVVDRRLSEDAVKHLERMVLADGAATRIGGQNLGGYTQANLERIRQGEPGVVYFSEPHFKQEAARLIAESRTPTEKEYAKSIAAKLLGTEYVTVLNEID